MTDPAFQDQEEQVTPKIGKFRGGLVLPEHKDLSTGRPIKIMPLSKRYILPITQHSGQPAVAEVKVGDQVLKGQVIARTHGFVGSILHAPTSGKISAIEPHPVAHPSGLPATCIVLEADGDDEPIKSYKLEDWRHSEPLVVRNYLQEMGVVGLGGAVFPTHIKLTPAADIVVEKLILNGAECEPYISCDDMLMREYAEQIISGAHIAMHILGTNKCALVLEDNKPDAIAALEKAIADNGREDIEIHAMPSRYPEGGERQLIQALTGKEVPTGGLPVDLGFIVQNVGTMAAVHNAVVNGEPLVSRIVTVTGKGITHPGNVEVRLGTLFSEVMEFCGGYTDSVERLIMGGPMMGFALPSDNVPVIKRTNCILVAAKEEVPVKDDPMPCIRCGECAQVCPASLLPQQLYWYARSQDFNRTKDYHIFNCIECGCCDLVCPSHIPLTSYFRFAKSELWIKERERDVAESAKQRFEAREKRVEKQKATLDEKRKKKRESIREKPGSEEAKSEIAAAVERAAKKRKDVGPDQT
ncbi:MAG: electron transport complex subunit RsxC [Gammaproteobacteria bacterium]